MQLKTKSFIIFTIFLFFLVHPLSGQVVDTLHDLEIKEVKIFESRSLFYREDKSVYQVDSFLLNSERTSCLSDLLTFFSPANVKTYGNGNFASVSIRGSGANHTTVNWNGFPLNSITSGDMDLSLISMNSIDKVSVTTGASGSLYGNGAFGGAIDLVNQPNWQNHLKIKITSETGSYSNHLYAFNINIGNNKLQYKLAGNFNKSKNNFQYVDNYKFGNPIEEQIHNKLLTNGLTQNLNLLLPKQNSLDFGLWYFRKLKEIPGMMGSYGESNQVQQDSSLKAFIRWNKIILNSSISAKTGYFSDYIHFIDKNNSVDTIYSIDSKIHTSRVLSDITFRNTSLKNLIVDAAIAHSYLIANVVSYGKPVQENVYTLMSGMKYNLQSLVINFSFRREFYKGIDPNPLLSFGFKYELLKNYIVLRSNISNKFRVPSFNDKYWQPGGNPDILPEKGWETDFGAEINLLNDITTSKLLVDISVYSTTINNWIQWSPDNGFWTPKNLKKVWARGLESLLKYKINVNHIDFQAIGNFNYTRSTNLASFQDDAIIGKQLRYTPVYTAKGIIHAAYKKCFVDFSYNYTGKQHTTDDNDPVYKLSPYKICNLTIGSDFVLNNFLITLQIKCNNLFNTEYQAIRSFPMQGRSFYLSVSFCFSKS